MPGRETGVIFKKFESPELTAQYLPEGRRLLAMLKDRMARSGIDTLTWRRTLPGDVSITVSSKFGTDMIVIGGGVSCTICPPLDENDETREYWSTYRVITSSDGLFTFEYLPIKKMVFTDDLNQTVEINFDEPDA